MKSLYMISLHVNIFRGEQQVRAPKKLFLPEKLATREN